MSKVKYAPLVSHIVNEHHGFTFQTSRSGNVMMKAQSNDRARQLRQQNRQVNLMNPSGHWRTLSASQQAAWNLFAFTYPQASKRNPLIFLTGYQLFLKRNQYCHLNYDIENGFIFEPIMAELPAFTIVPTIEQTQNVLDVTEPYIRQFGIIPAPGQWLLFKAVPMSVKSGQFYETIYLQLQVLESYIDGLFISLELPPNMPEVVFSVFLSKPYSQSVAYSGTKTRYMGCFTSKTFLELTDTPGSYVGAAGKTVTVKADETGLEFTTPAAGGLTCETLAACPTIVTVQDLIEILIDNVVITGNVSLPPVKRGILYNWFAANDPRGITKGAWRVQTYDDWVALSNLYGGATVSGGAFKETGLTFWQTPNAGATNLSKLNARAGAVRYGGDGAFYNYNKVASFQHYGSTFYQSWPYAEYFALFECVHDTDDFNLGTDGSAIRGKRYGLSIRAMLDIATVADGQTSKYTGNNGRIYRTIAIGGKEYLADNLCETLYNNNDTIPVVTDNVIWKNLNDGACCDIKNDINNR